ncbi:hypothetical protein [Kineococcus sp. SYSU DK002]|uniref:hypothetical protein n=1 Tax=Kineococcus sp. SYSU DK002 TaxID=3383123 RepID=UPI003D7C878F
MDRKRLAGYVVLLVLVAAGVVLLGRGRDALAWGAFGAAAGGAIVLAQSRRPRDR